MALLAGAVDRLLQHHLQAGTTVGLHAALLSSLARSNSLIMKSGLPANPFVKRRAEWSKENRVQALGQGQACAP